MEMTKGWVNGLVLNVRKIKMDEEKEPAYRQRLKRMAQELEPMEVVYLDDLYEIINEFEDIVNESWVFHVELYSCDPEAFYTRDLKDIWKDFKGCLREDPDRMEGSDLLFMAMCLYELRRRLELSKCGKEWKRAKGWR